jgi:hypothetical protein
MCAAVAVAVAHKWLRLGALGSLPRPRPQVRTYDGAEHAALAFVSGPLFKLPAEVLPTESYLASVRSGARDNFLDPAYQVIRLLQAIGV